MSMANALRTTRTSPPRSGKPSPGSKNTRMKFARRHAGWPNRGVATNEMFPRQLRGMLLAAGPALLQARRLDMNRAFSYIVMTLGLALVLQGTARAQQPTDDDPIADIAS